MSGWDSASVSYIPGNAADSSFAGRIQLGPDGQPLGNSTENTAAGIEQKFLNFLSEFMDNTNQFIYRYDYYDAINL